MGPEGLAAAEADYSPENEVQCVLQENKGLGNLRG